MGEDDIGHIFPLVACGGKTFVVIAPNEGAKAGKVNPQRPESCIHGDELIARFDEKATDAGHKIAVVVEEGRVTLPPFG